MAPRDRVDSMYSLHVLGPYSQIRPNDLCRMYFHHKQEASVLDSFGVLSYKVSSAHLLDAQLFVLGWCVPCAQTWSPV